MTLDVMSIEKMMMNKVARSLMDKHQENDYGINEKHTLDNLLLLISDIKLTKNGTTEILTDGKSS